MKATFDEVAKDLRRYIDHAAAGEPVTIEENGKVLASLVRGDPSVLRLIQAAQERGWRLPTRPKPLSNEMARVTSAVAKTASEMVIEDRR